MGVWWTKAWVAVWAAVWAAVREHTCAGHLLIGLLSLYWSEYAALPYCQ